jgi:hypothetical protein
VLPQLAGRGSLPPHGGRQPFGSETDDPLPLGDVEESDKVPVLSFKNAKDGKPHPARGVGPALS